MVGVSFLICLMTGRLGHDIIFDMMPDDIPHTDDKVKRKIHPRAKDCFIFSLVSVAPLVCGLVTLFLDDFTELPFYFVGCGTAIVALCYISLFLTHPVGIMCGVDSLVQIRKDSSYSGKEYAIAGITISTFQLAVIGCLYWRGTLMVWHSYLLTK